jgi:hypothetical protein
VVVIEPLAIASLFLYFSCMKYSKLFVSGFMTLWAIHAYSQGCSDAGFCTMGAMKPDQHYSKKLNLKLRSMEVSFYRGTTTLTPIVKSFTADLNFSLNSKNTFQVKLPYQWVDGRLGSTSGLSDISLCYTRNLVNKESYSLNLSFGAKVPTNRSDKATSAGFPLPMYYQTSLGTFDGIMGMSIITRKWLVATGIQMAFNENNNQFLWGAWNGSDESPDYIERYSRAKFLKRGTDVMLRVERNFRFSRLNFSVGLLPIYRITHDEIERADGTRIKPEGTTGMALSGIVTAGYSFNVRNGIKVLVGHKITQRDENPDGLTRHLVTSLTYFFRF